MPLPTGASPPAVPGPAPHPPAGSGVGSPGEESTAPFIKLAMRNMVRKGRQSLVHFGLTAVGLTGFLVLVAWLGRPNLPQ